MAFPTRGRTFVSAPRLLTVIVSLALVGLVLLSFTTHLPAQLAIVLEHRLLMLLAGYAVLLAGVLLRGL